MKNEEGSDPKSFILNTGAKMPSIGLGTWLYGGEECIEAVNAALKIGYRQLDCAHLYENEKEVGKALQKAFKEGLRREDLFLTSKLILSSNSQKRALNSIEDSLENLGVCYLDLYVVYWPDNSFEDATDRRRSVGKEYRVLAKALKPTWEAMEDLVRRGLVKSIGVCNFKVGQIEELLRFAEIPPAVNQAELHPFWRQDELVKFCQLNNIHVSALTPLGVPIDGAAAQTDGRPDDEPGTPRIALTRSRSVHGPMLKLSVITEIAEACKKTPEQVILRWGLQRGMSLLPCSVTLERIQKNFDIFNWSLSEKELDRMNKIEPQVCLFGSGLTAVPDTATSSTGGHLQAVSEIDDDAESDS